MAGRRRQRGQAFLLVLVFVAAFLFVVWAALTLVSAGILALISVQADTRATYALDAGLAFGIQLEDAKTKGTGCTADLNKTFSLPYANGTITVTVNVTPIPGCKTGKPSYTVQVTVPASVTSRLLNAQIASSNAGKKGSWLVSWQQYQ